MARGRPSPAARAEPRAGCRRAEGQGPGFPRRAIAANSFGPAPCGHGGRFQREFWGRPLAGREQGRYQIVGAVELRGIRPATLPQVERRLEPTHGLPPTEKMRGALRLAVGRPLGGPSTSRTHTDRRRGAGISARLGGSPSRSIADCVIPEDCLLSGSLPQRRRATVGLIIGAGLRAGRPRPAGRRIPHGCQNGLDGIAHKSDHPLKKALKRQEWNRPKRPF
jgi:hypothetical protein